MPIQVQTKLCNLAMLEVPPSRRIELQPLSNRLNLSPMEPTANGPGTIESIYAGRYLLGFRPKLAALAAAIMPQILRIFCGKTPAGGSMTPPESRTRYTVRK